MVELRRRPDRQVAAVLLGKADERRQEGDAEGALILSTMAHEFGCRPCTDDGQEHLARWVEAFRPPTVHELAAAALLDPYLEPEPPDGWHLIDNADADDVRHALEVAIERLRAVAAFLRDVRGDRPLDELRRDADVWRDSADLNEAWIAGIRLRAGELLGGPGAVPPR